MASDSDDDFERFLQEDDSASMSSASPVKKKKSTSRSTSKSKSDGKSKAISAARSSSSRRAASASSLSVVAAAERLLAASGKGRAKAKPAVQEEEDAEEPPPSYSDDPYAFELGAKPSYMRGSDDDKDDGEEDDDDEDMYSYKGKKNKRTISKSESKAKSGKKDKEREPPPAKREVKTVKTLEERVAEILKRTGSTTTITPSTAAVEKEESEEDEGGASEDGEVKPSHAPFAAPKRVEDEPKMLLGGTGDDGSDADDGSDLHRLSFSDSLGMESADFEVGVHARRKLDQSRLSLSSHNSEKFKVNIDALEESELPSHNRYDRQDDDFGQSLGPSDTADGSDYGDDGFELDQTTDAAPAFATTTQETRDDRENWTRNAPSSFVSEFEKMKSLFSLESPPKLADVIETPDAPPPVEQDSRPAQSNPPAESDTFGYDDEDFETDEVKASIDAAGTKAVEQEQEFPVDDSYYRDDDFEGGEPTAPLNSRDKNVHRLEETSQVQRPQETTTVIHTAEPPELLVRSSTESTGATDAAVAEKAEAISTPPVPIQIPVDTSTPPAPRSPPPPPPPDEDEAVSLEPPSLEITQPRPHFLVPQRQPPLVDQSLDRFRAIETQVSSLRFMQSSQAKASAASSRESSSRHEPAIPQVQPPPEVIEDAIMAEEMREIERLMDQARRARKDRRKSITVRSSAKESELALRLQQAQRQILQFKQHVQELADGSEDAYDERAESQSSHRSVASKRSDDNSAVALPSNVVDAQESNSKRTENERLKKEVESQERLIQGFQRENEQLMKQLKQVQRDLHYDVHKENEALRIQLKELRTRLDRAPYSHRDGPAPVNDSEEKTQYRAAIEARLHAEAHAESLQEDLIAQAKRHQAALNEMKIELEKAKKAKIDLECQYEGLDLRKMESETRQIKALKDQVEMQKREHDHALAGLQKKIDWYVSNQRLLDEQDEKISSLKEENKQLKQELENRGTGHGGSVGGLGGKSPIAPGKAGGSRSNADIRRIQELEARLSEMEEAMRRRHPDSLVSLIVASRKADEESMITDLKAVHQKELNELRGEMEVQESNHEKKLNAFRQQQEKLILQYQKQISSLERQLANKENQRGGALQTVTPGRNAKKPAALPPADETELYRVRRFYAEKIKEVERKWEAKYRSLKKQQYASAGPGGGGDSTAEREEGTLADAAKVIQTLQQQVKVQDEELRNLRSAGARGSSQGTGSWDASSLRRRVESLESQLKTSEDARRQLVETLTSLQAFTPTPSPPVDGKEILAKVEGEVASKLEAVEANHEAETAEYRQHIAALEQQIAEQSSVTQALRNQFAGHIKEVERLQLMLTEAEREKKMLQDAAERVPLLESDVALLRQQLAVPQTPSMLQFRSLELRIETLSQKHQLREAELKTMLMQATQSSQLEKLQYERMHEKALALKNAEILSFKRQLEEILDELELLRAAQAASPL